MLPGLALIAGGDTGWFMRLCEPNDWPGVVYEAAIDKVDGSYAGKWQFVQLIRPSRHWVHETWGEEVHSQNGQVVGDDYPYLRRESGTEWSKSDSPGHGLLNNLKVKVDNEQFWVYLMFQPYTASPLWVPLEYQSWKWSGEAEKQDGVWTITAQPAPVKVTNRTPTTTFPEWSEDFDRGD